MRPGSPTSLNQRLYASYLHVVVDCNHCGYDICMCCRYMWCYACKHTAHASNISGSAALLTHKDRWEALAVVRDMCMHWHYTHVMIHWAGLLQEVGLKYTIFICNIWYYLQAIDDWVFNTPGLHALLLTEDKWKTLREIADVLEVWLYNSIKRTFIFPSLQPFLEVTLQMSHNKIPTIPFVLPVYHKMEKHLEAVLTSWENSFKIQNAAEQGLGCKA